MPLLGYSLPPTDINTPQITQLMSRTSNVKAHEEARVVFSGNLGAWVYTATDI
jgi:hypothetical protein